MKSKSLEMILDNMYFIASVDEKEEKVFVALDFEEAGRRYAELKSEGDAIIWHFKKKKLGSRDSACEILCDFGTPIEMVSEERLLRLMSLVVAEGEDSPLESPIIMSEEISDPIQKMVEDIHKILPDDAEVEMVERDLHEGINDIVSDPWFLGIKKKIITKSILLAYKENIEISNAYLLVKLRFQFFSISMKRIIDEFRNFMKNSEGIENWSKSSRERLAVSAVISNFKWKVHKTRRKQTSEEQKTSPEKVLETTKTKKDPDQIETSPGELDQRSTPRDLVDEWKEREEEPVSIPKVELSHEVKKPKPIPSSRVLLRGFLSYCKKRGSSKTRIHRRILHVKTFLKFIKTNGRSILEIDEEGVKEFESFLRDVQGFKRGTGGEYSGTVRIFYDYTNSEGITNIDIRRSIRAWCVTRMMEIVGKPLTGVYDDESNTIYEEVNQRILEGIEKLGNKVKRMELTRFVLNIPKSDKLSSGNKAFIGMHLHYLVEHNILEKSSVDKYDVFSKSISEPTFHKVGETMGVVSSEELMVGFSQWLKKKGFKKIHRNEYNYVSITRDFIEHINDIGKTILDDDREHMFDSYRLHLRERNLKESTIGTYIRGICVFYNYMDENPPEELSDRNKITEREIQPFFNDFVQWLERNHYKKISRTVGIVRGFKDYIESGEKTILDDDRDRMIDLYRLYLQDNKCKRSTIKTYVGTIHLFYRFIDEMDEHYEKAGEVSTSSDDPEKEERWTISYKQLIGGFRSWLKKKGFISMNKGGYGHGYIGCVEDYIKYVDKRSNLMNDREEMIEAHKSHLQDKGLKYGSISYSISAINAFYRFVEEDLVDANLKPDIPKGKGKRKEMDGSKSIPSIEVLLEEFDDRCKMRGMTKKTVRRYVSYAKDFLEFAEETGEFISDVDERTLEAFKSHLRDDRGFEKGTISVYFAAIRAFYDYTNFKGITDVSEPISHGAEGVKPILSIRGLLNRFANDCKMKGMKKKDVSRRIMQSRAFIDFVKGNGGSILEVDEQTLEEYKSYLKDDRGFKEATIESHFVGIHAFYNYTNSKGFTDVSMRKKWNQIPSEEESPPKALKSMTRIASETIDGHEHGHQKNQKTQNDWIHEILGDELQKVDIKDPKDVDGKRKNERSLYTGINQRILLELEDKTSMSRSELIKSMFGLKGIAPTSVSNIMDAHLRYLVDQGSISKPQWGIYTLVDDDKKVVTGKTSLLTTKDEKTPHRELSAEDWIRRITNGEKPYTWISYGSMDDTRVVQRGQGTPIYSEINRRIMVEVRASKDPVKRSELIRPVFDLGRDERISQVVNTILNNHLRYLLHRNVLKQPGRGYYESVPDNVPDYRIDPIFERKIHEGVMDRMTKK